MKLDRLLGILTTLLQNSRVTAPQLAEKFEVSRRTIGRDIEALCRAGIPVVTMQGGRGGIAIAEGYKLDKSVLTVDELFGIVAALKGIGSISEQSQLERTLEKLSANKDAVLSLQEPIMIDLASHYKGSLSPKIASIKRAVLEQRLIAFDYYSDKGKARRHIEPYVVIFKWTAWYVFGFCLKQQDWRMFKLQRLWEMEVCKESFIKRPVPPERYDFDGHFSDQIRLVALFETSAKSQLIEEYGPDCFTETEDGKLLFENGYTNQAYIVSWLLQFGDRVKVLQSDEIAEQLYTIAKNIMKQYH